MKKTPKHVANLSSCQHSDATREYYSPDLFISGTPEHPNTRCSFSQSVVRCYLAVNATLIVNLITNSEQTDKSVCYESDEIRNSFRKKPVGISHACRFLGGNIIIPPKVTKLQLRLFNNLHFQHRSERNRSPKSRPKSTNSALLVLTSVCSRRKFEPLMLNSLLST